MSKKLILLGSGCYFIDSFILFKEQGFDVHVVKIPHNIYWNERNYETYSDLSFNIHEIVDYSKETIKQLIKDINPNEQTLIIGGGYYEGDSPILSTALNNSGKMQLELLYKLSKELKEQNIKSKCVRYFNGDTIWGSKEQLDLFAKKTQYLDCVLFDNNLLQEYVLYNIPTLKEKENYICQLELPLKRNIKINLDNVTNKFALLGRHLSVNPLQLSDKYITKFPIRKWYKNKRYFLAGNRPMNLITNDREDFYNQYSSYAFGLGHFYDSYTNSKNFYENNKFESYGIFGQNTSFVCDNYSHPVFYAHTNTANKDITYLMNGIIPIISNTSNSFYKTLAEKEMILLLNNENSLNEFTTIEKPRLLKMKQNILNNIDLFCFEPTAKILTSKIMKLSP